MKNLTEKDLEKYFFEITIEQLIYHGIEVQRYKTIGKEIDNKFLGIKRDWHYPMNNRSIFYAAKHLYQYFMNIDPKTIETLWAATNEDENWFSSMVCGKSIESYLREIIDEINKRNSNSVLFETDDLFYLIKSNILKEKKFPEFSITDWNDFIYRKLSGLKSTIICFNGYDIQYFPSYYSALFKGDNDRLFILPISRKNQEKIVYDADLFRKGLINHQTQALCILCDNILDKFKTDLLSFIGEYFKRYLTPLNKEYFCSIMFDVFDMNMKPGSVDADDDLLERLKKFKLAVSEFLHKNSVINYSSVTDFIIEFKPLSPEFFRNDNWKKIDEVITLDRAYQRSCSRFKKILLSPTQRQTYEQDCIESYKRIENFM